MVRLISINLLFALGLMALLLGHIADNYIWLGFITAWCVAEGILSRDLSIKWWQWTILFLALALLDLTILFIFKP